MSELHFGQHGVGEFAYREIDDYKDGKRGPVMRGARVSQWHAIRSEVGSARQDSGERTERESAGRWSCAPDVGIRERPAGETATPQPTVQERAQVK